MRVIIAGTRTFNDYQLLIQRSLGFIYHEIYRAGCHEKFTPDGQKYMVFNEGTVEIVSGMANGADKLGEKMAAQCFFQLQQFPADWDAHGKSAGNKRNLAMAKYAKEQRGMLIAFWNGKSRGTKNMIELAKKNGLTVNVVRYDLENKGEDE